MGHALLHKNFLNFFKKVLDKLKLKSYNVGKGQRKSKSKNYFDLVKTRKGGNKYENKRYNRKLHPRTF